MFYGSNSFTAKILWTVAVLTSAVLSATAGNPAVAASVGVASKSPSAEPIELKLSAEYKNGLTLLAGGKNAEAEVIAASLFQQQQQSIYFRHLLIRTLLAQNKRRQAALLAAGANSSKLPPDLVRDYTALVISENLTAKSAAAEPGKTKRSGVVFGFNAAPTTNITKGGKSQTIYLGGIPFVVDAGSVEKSGITIGASAQAYHLVDLTEKLSVRLAGGVAVNVNVDDVKSVETTVNLSADFTSTAILPWTVNTGPLLEHVWIGSDAEM